ncbi:MAG: prepilin peptidase [Planctomycetes bacterium]|nr:prepilin peptidase [Planctomycetota bacterium]
MTLLVIVCVLLFATTAAVTDILSHKIYNWTTYPGILVALAVHAGTDLSVDGWSSDFAGLEDSLKGFFLCGLLMLVCFVFFGVGGGDVKLMAMLGAFLGVDRGLEALLWTLVLGAALGLATLIWRVGLWKLISGVVRHVFWCLRLANWLPLSDAERQALQPPLFLAPSALAATVIVCFGWQRYLSF